MYVRYMRVPCIVYRVHVWSSKQYDTLHVFFFFWCVREDFTILFFLWFCGWNQSDGIHEHAINGPWVALLVCLFVCLDFVCCF